MEMTNTFRFLVPGSRPKVSIATDSRDADAGPAANVVLVSSVRDYAKICTCSYRLTDVIRHVRP